MDSRVLTQEPKGHNTHIHASPAEEVPHQQVPVRIKSG